MHGTFFPLRGRRQKRRHLSPSLPRGEPPHFRRKIMGLLMTLAPSSSRSTPRPPSLTPAMQVVPPSRPFFPSRSEETLLFPTNVTCCQNQRRRRRRERERSRQLNSSKAARSPSLPFLALTQGRLVFFLSPLLFQQSQGWREGRKAPPPFCSQRTAAGAAEKECRTERLPQVNKFNKVSHSNRNTSLVKAPVKLFHIKKPT